MSVELPNADHKTPVGAVVIYKPNWGENEPGPGADYWSSWPGDTARMVVVQHSRDCDGTPLYMLAKEPIEPPPGDGGAVYSRAYMAYRMHAGWYCGNLNHASITDTGARVQLQRFPVERFPG